MDFPLRDLLAEQACCDYLGVAGRAIRLVQLWVAEAVDAATLQLFVGLLTRPDMVVYADE